MMLRQVFCSSQAEAIRCYTTNQLNTSLLKRQSPRCWRVTQLSCLAAQAAAVTDRSSPAAESQPEGLERQVAAEGDDQIVSGSAAPTESPSEADRPRSSSEAINRGIEELNAGRPREAIELFQAALELPGNGFMRFAGTVREYRCPSEGEEQAALYNMACAYAALRQRDSALACLEGAFEAGLSDFAAVRSDPDLSAVRGQDLDKLLSKYDNLLAKLFKKKEDDENKPWLGW